MSISNELHVILGTGPLGKAVMRELVTRGKHVRMVNRSGKADGPAGVEVVAGDAHNTDNTTQLCRSAAVVYQCAQPAYNEWPEKFPAFQAGILQGVAAANAKFIVAENLYMYGEVNGTISEDLPYSATTRKGRTRAQMAESLLSAPQR